MDARSVCLTFALVAAAGAAHAAQGLVAPAADALWPQWQARITVQTAGTLPLAARRLVDAGAVEAQHNALQGGAVFGDYYFARPSFGAFRASGGLMTGAQGGALLAGASVGPRLGVNVASSGGLPLGWASSPYADTSSGTVPYLGLGFTGTAHHSAFAFSADLGLVAERPGAAGGVGRAVFGSQGIDSALREMRLSPLLQLGMRYSF